MNIDIVPIPLPASAEDPVNPLYEAYARVSRAEHVSFYGHDDLAHRPLEYHVSDADQTDERTVKWVAFPQGERAPESAIGIAAIDYPMTDNTHLAFAWIVADPERRSRGIAKTLLPVVEQHLRESGRTSIQVWTNHRPYAGTDGIEAKSGVGQVDPSTAEARWLTGLGFVLEQTERHSVLEIPDDGDPWWQGVDSRLQRDLAATRGEYELVQCDGPTPQELLENYALLRERMSVDVPDADLDFEEEHWDPERIVRQEGQVAAMGRLGVKTFVRHVPSGRLVAYTEMYWPKDRPAVIYQWDTFVHGEHRGHRLGAIVKAANLRYLRSLNPDARRVHTWNAGENDHMLAINVELGFAPSSVEGGWQKRV